MENNDKYVTLLPTIVDKTKLLMGGNIRLILRITNLKPMFPLKRPERLFFVLGVFSLIVYFENNCSLYFCTAEYCFFFFVLL